MQSVSTEAIMSGRDLLEPLSNNVAGGDGGLTPDIKGIGNLWKIWRRRDLLGKVGVRALIVSTLVVFLIPNRFESITRVLPSDSIPHTGGMLSALAGLSGSSSGSSSSGMLDLGEMLGTKSNGALYVALLKSRTVQENLVRRFDLTKVYRVRTVVAAREILEKHAEITEDRKVNVLRLSLPDGIDTMEIDTIIDGLRVKRVGGNNFRIVRDYVDEIVTLPDAGIFEAMLWIMSHCKLVVEGAAAAPVAALLHGLIKAPSGSKVVCVLSGGNVNLDQLRGLKWN